MKKKKKKKNKKKNTNIKFFWVFFSIIFFVVGCSMVLWFITLKNELLAEGQEFMDGIGGILAFSSFGAIPLGIGIICFVISIICFIIYIIKTK